jgi:hypothetical protein
MELKVNSTKKYIFLKNSNGQKTWISKWLLMSCD